MKLIEIIDLDSTQIKVRFSSPALEGKEVKTFDITPQQEETHAQIIQRIKATLENEWGLWETYHLARLKYREVVGAAWDGSRWYPPAENRVISADR